MAPCDETKNVIISRLNYIESKLNDIDNLYTNGIIDMKEIRFKIINLRQEIFKLANSYSSILLKDKKLKQEFLNTQYNIHKCINFYESTNLNVNL